MKSDLRSNMLLLVDELIGAEHLVLRDAAMVILASIYVGRHAIRISKAIQVDRLFCVRVGVRMRSAGRWRDEIYEEWIDEEWIDEEMGILRFSLDALTAAGMVNCRRGKYKARPT